jgi:hypothetical protein
MFRTNIDGIIFVLEASVDELLVIAIASHAGLAARIVDDDTAVLA